MALLLEGVMESLTAGVVVVEGGKVVSLNGSAEEIIGAARCLVDQPTYLELLEEPADRDDPAPPFTRGSQGRADHGDAPAPNRSG